MTVSPNTSAMIEIRNVSKWYGTMQVLNQCSTHVSKGEVVVVCGPSGSGKSHPHQDGERAGGFPAGRDHRQWRVGG